MLRGGEGARRGPRIDRMGGLVLAMIVGVLVPPLVVYVVASRDPLPRSCGAGQVSATHLDGAVLHTTGADLWYSEGFPGQPRKLVDFAPPPTRLSPGATPSPSAGAAAAASPTPVGGASPSATATSTSTVPRILAGDIAEDRRLVAFLVSNPPDRPGFVSLRVLSPNEPAKLPVEGWFSPLVPNSPVKPVVRILGNNKVLVIAGVARELLSAPSPAVSPASTPSPSPSAAPSPAPALSLPTPSPSPQGGSDGVVVVVDPARPADSDIADHAPLQDFLAFAHAGWPDTRSYRVEPTLPVVDQRTVGQNSRVAGTVAREVGTPLARRSLNQLVVGQAGRAEVAVVCSATEGVRAEAFSPDESGLALYNGQETLYLDLRGTHSIARLLDGRILSWRG